MSETIDVESTLSKMTAVDGNRRSNCVEYLEACKEAVASDDFATSNLILSTKLF